MNSGKKILTVMFWILTLGLFAWTTWLLHDSITPVEKTMGPIQKVFYFHLPVAINTFVAAMVVFIASIGYLWQRKMWWDDLASASARVTALYCSIVLLTGMIWGKEAWGQWWTWSPRLTFSLVLWLLYVVYLMIRPAIESPQRRALVSSVYGIAAFLDVPVVYLSVKMMPDIHPKSIELAPEMKTTLLAWFLPVSLLMWGLLITRYKLNRRQRELRAFSFDEGEEPAFTNSGMSPGGAL